MKKTSTFFAIYFFLVLVNLCQAQLPLAYKTFSIQTSDFLLATPDNAVLNFGNIESNMYTTPGHCTIVKLDATGNIIWSRSYNFNDSVNRSSRFISAINCNDSMFATVGTMYAMPLGYSSQNQAGFCMKFKPNGDTLWCRKLSAPYATLAPYSITQAPDSGFVICGNAVSSTTTIQRTFLTKLTKSGSLTWMKFMNISSYDNQGYTVKTVSDSGFVLTGSINYGSSCAMYAKFTKAGNLVWCQKICDGSNNLAGMDMAVEHNGFLFLLADPTTPNKPALVKTDTSGAILWDVMYLNYNYSGFGFGLSEEYRNKVRLNKSLHNSNVIVTNLSGIGFALHTDSAGNVKRVAYPGMRRVDQVQLANKTFMVIGNPRQDIVGKSLDADDGVGLIVTDSLLTGNIECYSTSSVATASAPAYSSSSVSCSLLSGGLASSLILTVSSMNIASELNCLGLIIGIPEFNSSDLSLFPNPGEGKLTLQSTALNGQKLNFDVYDVSGKKIITQEILLQNSSAEIDLGNIKPSIYFYRLSLNDQVVKTGKLVISR